MKIFTSDQIREGDRYTIQNEPVSSLDLMERAAQQCSSWLTEHFGLEYAFQIFCGTGNNGGDGLALGRILQTLGYRVEVYQIAYSTKQSTDCLKNKERLRETYPNSLKEVRDAAALPGIKPDAVVIDALFGTGLNRPVTGLAKEVIERINQSGARIIAIDIPSGIAADEIHTDWGGIEAAETLSFEFYKLAFLFPENFKHTGKVHLLPIQIHPDYIKETATPYFLTDLVFAKSHLLRRGIFSHKGTFGHALIAAGSKGKAGAAVLATRAALHAGAGLVTACVPESCYQIVQIAAPEAMCMTGGPHKDFLSQKLPDSAKFNSIGIGPGIGTEEETFIFLKELIETSSNPLVVDADALNLISKHPELLEKLPPKSVLTPHPKEFERLFGKTSNANERLRLQIRKSRELEIILLLKGHYTAIASPDGRVYFNSTGNPGMATGGSGDVLTGILTALLAQGYEPFEGAVFGAYLHGLAGDLALASESEESMTATSIIQNLGKAFRKINDKDH